MIKRGILLIVSGTIVGLAAFYIPTWWDQSQVAQAQSTGKAFVEAVTKGDTKAAYALTSTYFKQTITEAEFASNWASLKTANPKFFLSDARLSKGQIFFSQDVDNLPAAKNGRTDGEFSITMSGFGSTWYIDAARVN